MPFTAAAFAAEDAGAKTVFSPVNSHCPAVETAPSNGTMPASAGSIRVGAGDVVDLAPCRPVGEIAGPGPGERKE